MLGLVTMVILDSSDPTAPWCFTQGVFLSALYEVDVGRMEQSIHTFCRSLQVVKVCEGAEGKGEQATSQDGKRFFPDVPKSAFVERSGAATLTKLPISLGRVLLASSKSGGSTALIACLSSSVVAGLSLWGTLE